MLTGVFGEDHLTEQYTAINCKEYQTLNNKELAAKNLDGGVTESMSRPGIKEDIYAARTPIGRQSVGSITNQKHDQSGFMIDHNNEGGSNQKNMINLDLRKITAVKDGDVSPLERKLKHPIFVFFQDVRSSTKMISLGKDILTIAVPAAMAFAADPVASLIDTAFIGHIDLVAIWSTGHYCSIKAAGFIGNMACSYPISWSYANCSIWEREKENSLLLLSRILCSLTLEPPPPPPSTAASNCRPPTSGRCRRRPLPPSFFVYGFQDLKV
ncbi:hypothetical protein Tco_0026391 [Tanacetum coccineum]